MFSVNLCRKGRNFNSKNIIFTTDIGAFVTKPMYLPQVESDQRIPRNALLGMEWKAR